MKMEKLQAENELLNKWVKHHQRSVELSLEREVAVRAENKKLKGAIKAELERCGGTVPILTEVLKELER